MKVHIETALINEAFLAGGECPICAIRQVVDERVLYTYANEGVMEDATRARVNALGFCPEHFAKLYAADNKLGVALQTSTRLRELTRAVKPVKNPKEANKAADAIDKSLSTCAICSIVEEHMSRYVETVASLFHKNAEFRALFSSGKGFCMTHYAELLRVAPKAGGDTALYLQTLYEMQKRNLERLQEEILGFCDKFDYRYADRPWGNSKDSVIRTIAKIKNNKKS